MAIEVTAELHNAFWVDSQLHGDIIGDTKKRFHDNQRIHTSYVVENLGGGFYRTRNSTYRVFFAPGKEHENNPLEHKPVEENTKPALQRDTSVTIDLIKRLREKLPGLGLKEAKDIVENSFMPALDSLLGYTPRSELPNFANCKRDEFAKAALTGLLSNPELVSLDSIKLLQADGHKNAGEAYAGASYGYADAMMKAGGYV